MYPSSPACGRVINIVANLNVLINCDSAVFMKDAQDPIRVLNGTSVYQDRPAHSLLTWILGSSLKFLGVPNMSREILGTSGNLTNYQSLFYISYLFINFVVVLVAIVIGTKFILGKIGIESVKRNKVLLTLTILVISANELTKTFFWTPHSQMFNILLPVLALFFLQNRKRIQTSNQFLLCTSITLLLMFFYPLFGILFSILFFTSYSRYTIRLIYITIFASVYLTFPNFLEFVGGNHRNYVVEEYRQYVWIWDSFKNKELFQNIELNLNSFFSTIPFVPTLVLTTSALLLLLHLRRENSGLVKKAVDRAIPYLSFVAIYILALCAMGYYSRRLTLGLFIFLELGLIKCYVTLLGPKFEVVKRFLGSALVVLLVVSWVATNGPLS